MTNNTLGESGYQSYDDKGALHSRDCGWVLPRAGNAIHPCMPALYVADVASDAIGELYSSHTYVVEPGYVPDYENNRL